MTTLHQFRDKAARDLEVIKNAYWIIDFGPGGGDAEDTSLHRALLKKWPGQKEASQAVL